MKVLTHNTARPAMDGDGVNIRRVADFGKQRFDPFLMLDEIKSDDSQDFIGGFPPHPHRGIETFTYILKGGFEHRNHMGNVKVIRAGDVQWIKMFCVITAVGIDEDVDNDATVDFSAGINELRMLSQVMRLFQEQPVMLIDGDNPGEVWHTQFIPHPLADEQINQIWSTQGDTVYRPSLAYEITLAPVEPLVRTTQAARVASVGSFADSNMNNRNRPWPAGRETLYPTVPSVRVDSSNPQWAPAMVLVTGAAGSREATLALNLEAPVVGGLADFTGFPQLDIWIGGDTTLVGDLTLVGQLLQNPDADRSSGQWIDIDPVLSLSADAVLLDVENLPVPAGTGFALNLSHWTDLDNSNNSWQ